MITYKITDNGIKRNDGVFIINGGRGWIEYQKWLNAPNTPEPLYTLQELRLKVSNDIITEGWKRIDAISGSPRDKDRALMRAIKLSRKEAKNSATIEEIAELNNQELLANNIEEVENIISTLTEWTNSATAEELEGYDIINDPGWGI